MYVYTSMYICVCWPQALTSVQQSCERLRNSMCHMREHTAHVRAHTSAHAPKVLPQTHTHKYTRRTPQRMPGACPAHAQSRNIDI